MKLSEPLTGERIVLRNYKSSDLKFITDMWFDKQNGKYMSDPTREYVTDAYQRILEDLENSDDGYYLVAELANECTPIASAGIFPTGEDIYDIGYCVHKSQWRKGFGSEIVALLLDWLKQHGASKVMAEVAIDNLPSNLLLQKFGFSVERKSAFRKYNMDVRFDSYIYAKELRLEDQGTHGLQCPESMNA